METFVHSAVNRSLSLIRPEECRGIRRDSIKRKVFLFGQFPDCIPDQVGFIPF